MEALGLYRSRAFFSKMSPIIGTAVLHTDPQATATRIHQDYRPCLL